MRVDSDRLQRLLSDAWRHRFLAWAWRRRCLTRRRHL